MQDAPPSIVYCGVDIGTQGVRAVLMDSAGTCWGEGSAPITGSRRQAGRHEQRPQEWWDRTVEAVRSALAGAGDGVEIATVCVDATSGTVLVENRDGSPAGPALMYDDARAGEQAVRAQQVGADLWSALGYRMQASWALPKALWLLENDCLPAGSRLVHQSDHVVRRLVGGPVPTDTSNALKTGADLRDATWPEAVLADLGLEPFLLPPLVRPGTLIGSVGPEAGAATGLRPGTAVRAGMTDGCAAQIAAGALRPGRWSSALGTTLTIKGTTGQLVRDPTGAVYSHRHPDGGWMPGGASSSGAGVLSSTFALADLERLTRDAAALPGRRAVTYPLAGTGERFPFVAPSARSFTLGTTSGPQPDAQRFAALCLGLACVERLCYDMLAQLGADTSATVALTGGATRNRWLNQLRADLLGRTCVLPESAQAATGMAVLAASGDEPVADTGDRMVRIRSTVTPDPDAGAALHVWYRRLVEELARREWLDAALAAAVLDGASR